MQDPLTEQIIGAAIEGKALSFSEILHSQMNLKDQMKSTIPATLLHLVPKRFDIIGDILLISIPPELDKYKTQIIEKLIRKHKNIRTVLNKVGMLNGERRTARFEILLGDSTLTIHKEYGYRYKLDIQEVFFSSRLSYERKRVMSMVQPFENILVPFCGVGPFVIPAAACGANVVAIEKNPQGCKWLAENTRLNRVEENVFIIQGDVSYITNMLDQDFDRIILPIPYGMDHVIGNISGMVKKTGTIHFYTFKKQYQIHDLIQKFSDMGFSVAFYRKSGNVAPGVSRWVFDLVKQ
jgi:tRNA (guanine37-N1)-methyltransferase